MADLRVNTDSMRNGAGVITSSGDRIGQIVNKLNGLVGQIPGAYEGQLQEKVKPVLVQVASTGTHLQNQLGELSKNLNSFAGEIDIAMQQGEAAVSKILEISLSDSSQTNFFGRVRQLALGTMATILGWIRFQNKTNPSANSTTNSNSRDIVAVIPKVTLERKGNDIYIKLGEKSYRFSATSYQGNTGHIYQGTLRPDSAQIENELKNLGLSTSDARVMAAVSSHEGGFDSIQTYDKAKFTWGFIQFAGTGGLHSVTANIKSTAPEKFEDYFGRNGITIIDGKVAIQKKDGLLTGQDALQELHDNPMLWEGFIRASQDPTVQSIQVKTAYDNYYLGIINKTVNLNGKTYSLGELFKNNEYGRAMLFDRAVQRGVGSAQQLFMDAIAQSGASSSADIDKILEKAKQLEPSYTYRWDEIKSSF